MPGMASKTHSVTVIAATALAVNRFISHAGAYATSSNDVLGVSEIAAAADRACSCVTGYSWPVLAAEAVAEGDWVKPAGDGTGRAVVGSETDACGRAIAAASAGQLVDVRLMLQFGVRGEGGGGGYLGSGGLAEMLAVEGAAVVVGAWFLRTDVAPHTNYYLDALPADEISSWRPGLPIDPNAPVMTVVGLGSSSMEGNVAVGSVTTMSRTGNVLTVNGTTPLGGNYIGQKVRLFGMRPDDLPGVYEKASVGTNTFTVNSVGPDLANGDIAAGPQRRFRVLSNEPRTSPYWWAIQLSSGRAQNLANRGLPGAITSQVRFRVLADVGAVNPARVVVMAGSNDLSANVGGTPADDAAAAFADMPKLVEQLVALGVQIDLCALWPLGSGYADHAAWNARCPLYNAHLANLAAQYPDHCHYVDLYTPVVSDIGGGEMGMSSNLMGTDGVHMRSNAAFVLGRVLYNSWVQRGVLGRRWTPGRVEGGGQIHLAFRTNSGDSIGHAGGSGTEAVGVDVQRQSGSPTFVGSLVQRSDGYYAQRIVITAAGSGFESVRCNFTGLAPYMPKGSRWRFTCDLKTVNAPNGFGSWSLVFQTTVDSVSHDVYLNVDSVGNVVPCDQDSEFTYTSPEIQIPNPAGGSHTAAVLSVQATCIAATAPFTVEIANLVFTQVG